MILRESRDILFRLVDYAGFYEILKNDKLLLTVDLETRKGRQYVLGGFFSSFARSPLSSYFADKKGVIIVIDGKRLSQRYKIHPIDYWKGYYSSDEMEERLVADTNSIPDFSSYILEAHILIPRDEICSYAPYLAGIINLAKRKNIPLKVHLDPKSLSWTWLKKNNDINELMEILPQCHLTEKPAYVPKIFESDKKMLRAFLNLVSFAEKGGKLLDEAKSMYFYYASVAQNEKRAREFLIEKIIVPLKNNKSPGSAAYEEAVLIARLFKNKDPVKFVQDVFARVKDRLVELRKES